MSFDLSEEETAGVMMAVNAILRGIYHDEGIELWWDQPRSELLGHTPREAVVRDPTLVVNLALDGLGMTAT